MLAGWLMLNGVAAEMPTPVAATAAAAGSGYPAPQTEASPHQVPAPTF
jgi:hypothetical protein